MYLIVIVSMLLIVMTGCSGSNNAPLDPGDSKDGTGPVGFIYTAPADCYLVAQLASNMTDTAGMLQTQQQWTYFYSASGEPVAANAVSLNGNTLSVALGSQGGNYDVSWNGAQQIWQVTGNNNVPSFADTIVAPGAIQIDEPDTRYDSVSANGVTISYSGTAVDSVYLIVTYDRALSRRIDSTSSNATWSQRFVRQNTGSITLTANDLSGLPAKGLVRFELYAPKYKSKVVAGKSIATIAYSVAYSMHYIK